MKVSINRNLCMGDRNCNIVCPEVFEYKGKELISVVRMDNVPENYKKLLVQSVNECPAGAISINEAQLS